MTNFFIVALCLRIVHYIFNMRSEILKIEENKNINFKIKTNIIFSK